MFFYEGMNGVGKLIEHALSAPIRSRRLETAELFAQSVELLSLFGHGAPLGGKLVVDGAQVQVERHHCAAIAFVRSYSVAACLNGHQFANKRGSAGE
jgi:hypothetical protein